MSETGLREEFGSQAVDLLLARIADGATAELDPRLFASAIGFSETRTREFLDAAAAAGWAEPRLLAFCANCEAQTSERTSEEGVCTACDHVFADHGGIVRRQVYRLAAHRTRDIPWLIAIHGFNTHGAWQQEFSWRIATKLKYSAPVFIYKYGLIRFSVLVQWRHRQLARQLGHEIRNAVEHALASGIPEPPDVVLHSFGSQLFVQLLALPEFDDLRFGRVIAAGSVIRPDYDWSSRIRESRVEAVLNHRGGRDCAVPFAQFFIPGTGPGARHGFTDPTAINILNRDYKHSSCFDVQELKANLGEGGAWDRFLRRPDHSFQDQQHPPRVWRPVAAVIRGAARIAGVGVIATSGCILVSFGAAVWLKLLACIWEILS